MRLRKPCALLAALFSALSLCHGADVGSGAPSPAITEFFRIAYFRNYFQTKAGLPPLGDVKRFGSTGLVQEFPDAGGTKGVTWALVKANTSTADTPDGYSGVYQVWGPMYGFYGPMQSTVGYPTDDTQNCPAFDSANSCVFQYFDKGFALFVYSVPLFNGAEFQVRNQFYVKWAFLGGIAGLGRPLDSEQDIVAITGVTATVQPYANGAIYNITSGTQNGSYFAVAGAIWTLYRLQNGPAGILGLPTGDEFIVNGLHKQNFQGGTVAYTPGSDAQLLLPVASVNLGAIATVGPLKMNLGDTVPITAHVAAGNGTELTDRAISWSTSNSRVAVVQGSGYSVTLKAVGGGSATVQASSEGKVSAPLQVFVTAPCCQIGEGAPSPAIQQAFQDAVTRNRLSVLLPAAAPVIRSASGYTQMLQSPDNASAAKYLVAKSDRLPTAFVVSGMLLDRYAQLGGPAGNLGYPAADAVGGRQLFENGALGGSPVRVVTGPVLAKWAVLNYEAGPAGLPADEASVFLTPAATAGSMQPFTRGSIVAATAGPRAGQAYFVSGLILARYSAMGGPSGALGMPVTDEFASGASRQQNFEGGYLDYKLGDPAAVEHLTQRGPAITVTPSAAIAGSRIRIAITGFPAGAIRVSLSGQPDFLVATANGAYSWETYIPLKAATGPIAIHATDAAGTVTADGSYTVRGFGDTRAQIAKMSGDGQTGAPGAMLPQPLRVVVRDSSGTPVIGAPVVFQASPGAQVSPASAVTDQNGIAATWLRLPSSDGVAAATADSPSIANAPVTFNMRAAATALTNFPAVRQASAKGALVAAVAGIFRYHQNRGELVSSNGLADPAPLAQFLSGYCAFDAAGNKICDGFVSNSDASEPVANIFRAGEFVASGVDVSVEKSDLPSIRDLAAQGAPVLIGLALAADGNPAGGHYVVAKGVAADGTVLIQDPSPDLARTNLNEYLAGFQAASRKWTGTVVSAVRFVLRGPSPTRFLLAAVSQTSFTDFALDAQSAGGGCAGPVDLPDAGALTTSRFVYCDGAQPAYQVTVGSPRPYRASLTDFAPGGGVTNLSGSSPAVWRVSRSGVQLSASSQTVTFSADAVVNAATFAPGLAPGAIFSIFGSGVGAPGGSTKVSLGDRAGQVLASSAFQVNAVVPGDLAPGTYILRVDSAFGSAQQTVNLAETAPGIFLLGAGRDAIVNQDGKINDPSAPAQRGQVVTIYVTGLGAVTQQGSFSVAKTPVKAVLNGVEMPVAFAGLTPGFAGLYQVNLPIPRETAPGIDLPLLLRQGSSDSNAVPLSVQ